MPTTTLMRTLVERIRNVEAARRPTHRHSRRPAGAQAAGRQVRRRAPSELEPGQTFTLDDDPWRPDWIALSFIQRPEDMAEARKVARGRAG
jgi:hypothetical protein